MSTAPGPGAEQLYDHEHMAHLCAWFITHLFACPEYPPSLTSPPLPQFIASALHRTKSHSSVTFAALVLLQRLKAHFPAARGSSGHRLFISAFMIASKVICDDRYSNELWAIVAQGMFTPREIVQMEREMCSHLDWELTVDNHMLSNFEAAVKRDFSNRPTYPSSTTATPIPKASLSGNKNTNTINSHNSRIETNTDSHNVYVTNHHDHHHHCQKHQKAKWNITKFVYQLIYVPIIVWYPYYY